MLIKSFRIYNIFSGIILLFLFSFCFPKVLWAASSDSEINMRKQIKLVFNEESGQIEQKIICSEYDDTRSRRYFDRLDYFRQYHQRQKYVKQNDKKKISQTQQSKSIFGENSKSETFISEDEQNYRDSKTLSLFK
ncbi:MAG: putative secreted protein [Candidatus Phytoplasma cynodontis]|uniref:hypothetical protein n=1 Tax='Cynodon dactylon' phytoplasma TaxID=295320 RepID=UPI001265AFAA|nr:hypothetical protein ['Cynodon dactylon' phytoplasma]KAB8121793.1 hypothetical protein F1741_01535 ['Cynodon dactylon' phytoplasma]WIA07745.1 MAG: putative secreted protein [Candidatus Phytoplasma cynodontis]